MHEDQGNDRNDWFDDRQLGSKEEESQDPAWQHTETLAWVRCLTPLYLHDAANIWKFLLKARCVV